MAALLYVQKFIEILAEILQLDHAELDFGIYRIMNQKRKEIEAFLNNRLIPDVTAILKSYASEETDIAAMENEVFSHLTKFFSRYYEGGDFISKRRYKDDAYAIPYNGEEVKLYWANADQYYIKTSEYFKNYAFRLPKSRRKVHFVLRDAETEQNNNKAANNMERRFQICEEDCLAVVDGELNIYFTYGLVPKATKQEALIKDAEAQIVSLLSDEKYADFSELVTEKVPTDKNKDRTLLMKHLQDYTAKNNFDYFIHKDLGGFLRRELDFYIKNEVMFLDDLDVNHITSHLAQVKAIKQVGEKIIAFLAQLEDFQKKLWLKKKFVVGCDYCITLDRIPRTLYPEIIANEAQRKEWVKLFAIDEIKGDMMTEGYSEPLTEKFLEDNPFLVLDTKFFSAEFKHKLVGSMENVDEECNGLLINSENFQALELLQEKFKNNLDGIYIDPPYNTDATPILYKNSYKDSSWMTLINDRFGEAKRLICKDGYWSVAIDDVELHNLYKIMESIFCNYDIFQVIVNHYPGSGTGRSNVSKTHEYNLFAVPKGVDLLRGEPIEERQRTRSFSRAGTGENNHREGRPNSFYAVLVAPETKKIMGFETPPALNVKDYPKCPTKEGYIRIYPIGKDGQERCWSLGFESAKKALDDGLLECTSSNTIIRLYNDEADWGLLPSLWVDKKFSATTWGTNLLTNIFGNSGLFSFPKSLYTVMQAIYSGTYLNKQAFILDYFAGSGTTGHAVINLNREDGGTRKYILVEVNDYFNTVTKPRIEKVIYSEDWKDGKPVSRKGISQCFKYIRLEQYEDTLNNLQPKSQHLEFKEGDEKAGFEETYFLRYMLDMETKGDLFNLEWFKNPFAMSLKTTKDNELVDTPVDMVETFNYLIGLNVETLRYPKEGYCVVEGYTHIGNEHTLVIWRDCNKVSNEALYEFFRKQAYSTTDSEFDKIYVNGDNTLPNIKTDEEHWKVVLIEEEFKKRMFE